MTDVIYGLTMMPGVWMNFGVPLSVGESLLNLVDTTFRVRRHDRGDLRPHDDARGLDELGVPLSVGSPGDHPGISSDV